MAHAENVQPCQEAEEVSGVGLSGLAAPLDPINIKYEDIGEKGDTESPSSTSKEENKSPLCMSIKQTWDDNKKCLKREADSPEKRRENPVVK